VGGGVSRAGQSQIVNKELTSSRDLKVAYEVITLPELAIQNIYNIRSRYTSGLLALSPVALRMRPLESKLPELLVLTILDP
jgi:hypothetical protein